MTIFPTIFDEQVKVGVEHHPTLQQGVALLPGADPLLQNMQGLTAWDLALG